jgi:hypothetical protein
VRAVRDGTVPAPVSTGDFGALAEYLRIGPLTYIHVRAGRTRAGQLLDAERFTASYDEKG